MAMNVYIRSQPTPVIGRIEPDPMRPLIGETKDGRIDFLANRRFSVVVEMYGAQNKRYWPSD